jgi:hypothetical protein
MLSIYDNLRTDRQYSSSTGLTQAKFDELHNVFATIYVAKKTNPLTGVPPRFTNSREALFFVLYYLKVNPTYEVLGLCFGLSDFSVRDNYNYILPFLKESLAICTGVIPRLFESEQAFQSAFSQVEEIFVDGIEIGVERSKDDTMQKKLYSGKKKHIP